MNFKLQVGMGYSEVFETSKPTKEHQPNYIITKIIIIIQVEGIRIKNHFVNIPLVVCFTALLQTFDLIRSTSQTTQYFLKVFQKAQKKQSNSVCCMLIFIFYKEKAISFCRSMAITVLRILFPKKNKQTYKQNNF